jgi:CHAT domain-containing protein/Tfp pilus assembly protein PilF
MNKLLSILALTTFCALGCLGTNISPSAFAQSNTQKSAAIERAIESGSAALQQGQLEKAERDFKTALALFNDKNDDQTKLAEVVLLLAQTQMSTANLVSAQELLSKNWNAIKNHPDPERTDRAHYFLMSIFMQSGDYEHASEHSKTLVDRYSARYGEEHVQTIDARLNHGTVLINRGQKEQGLALLDMAFDVLKRKSDLNTYHMRLNLVATNFESSYQPTAATRYYERLIASLEQQPRSIELGISYFNLAILKKSERKLDESLLLHEKAIEVLTDKAGPDDIATIAAVSGLGNTYTVMGRPASGVQFLEQAYQRSRKVLGDNDNETWMYGNNYANALRELEKFEDARAIDQAAYDWRNKNLGPNHEATEISTLNLGLDWMGLRRFSEAEEKFNELYQSRLKRLGKNHPATEDAAKFVSLALSYNPKKVAATTTPKQNINTMDRLSANIMAGAMDQQGKPNEAIKYHKRAFEASIVEAGPFDPTTLLMLRNLALSENQLHRNSKEEVRLYEDLSRRTLAWARTEVAATAGKARSEDIRRVANRMIYDVIKLAQENPQAHHLLFQVLLDWKGLGTTEQALLNQLRSSPPNAEISQLVLRFDSLQKLLRAAGQSSEQVRADIDLIEVKLAEYSAGFGRSKSESAVKPKDIVSKLKPDEVLIDYIIGDRILPNSVEFEQEVFAFVTLADGRAIVKDLGELKAIKSILDEVGYESDASKRKKLFELLLQPLLKMKSVAKLKKFYVVPDGELFLVPFEGLLNDKNEAFGAFADVTLMRSSTGLLNSETAPAKSSEILLVGAPDYGSGEGLLSFPDLPAALSEVLKIETLAKQSNYRAIVLTKQAASEPIVRQAVAGRSIVHMATHGFFLGKNADNALEPPWRGGLALLGANSASAAGQAADDGIAYAAELANWSFDKTDLVVLSACETASGERSYVEGLRGIPAALAVSGAKRSLLAYWSVPDEGAANFMTTFYQHLLSEGLGYEDAFRATKRDAIAGRISGAELPEVWQAFVMMRN